MDSAGRILSSSTELGFQGNRHRGTDTPRSSISCSSRLSIVENDEESTDSLKNSTSSVSGQGNSSVENPPKGIMADRRIGAVGSSRPGIIENNGERTNSLKNPIGSVSGQGNNFVRNSPYGVVGDRRIGAKGSAQIPTVETDMKFSFLSNSNGWNDDHGNSCSQNLSGAVSSSQLATVDIEGREIGTVSSSQIPAWKIENLSLSESTQSNCWGLHDHNNGITSTGSTQSLDNPTQGLPFSGESCGISIGDSLNSITVTDQFVRNNLGGPYSSVIGQTPFFDSWNRSTARAGGSSSSEIARNPIAEGHLEDSSNMLFQNHFRLAFPNPYSWEQFWDDDIHWMARNRMGCKRLQEILEQGELVATQKILDATLGSMVEIMVHESGNRLFQKILQSCNEDQIFEIVLSITADDGVLINAAKGRYGSLAVQKLISRVKQSSPLVTRVTSALAPGIMSLMIHPFGFGVLRHCLIHLDDHQNTFIHEAAMEHCRTLGMHVKGCISLTEYLNHSKSTRKQLLLKKITELSLCLSKHPYGNYVVGAALQLEIPEVICNICHQLKGHYVHLSTNKFSSFVVQKCLDCWTEFVVLELLESGKLGQLAFDPYGNYIVQRALKMTKGVLKLCLINVLRPHSRNLQFHLHGHRIFRLLNGSVWK